MANAGKGKWLNHWQLLEDDDGHPGALIREQDKNVRTDACCDPYDAINFDNAGGPTTGKSTSDPPDADECFLLLPMPPPPPLAGAAATAPTAVAAAAVAAAACAAARLHVDPLPGDL